SEKIRIESATRHQFEKIEDKLPFPEDVMRNCFESARDRKTGQERKMGRDAFEFAENESDDLRATRDLDVANLLDGHTERELRRKARFGVDPVHSDRRSEPVPSFKGLFEPFMEKSRLNRRLLNEIPFGQKIQLEDPGQRRIDRAPSQLRRCGVDPFLGIDQGVVSVPHS